MRRPRPLHRRVLGVCAAICAALVLPSSALAAITFTASAGATSYTVGGGAVAVDPAFGVTDDGQSPSARLIDYITVEGQAGDTLAYAAGDYTCSSGADVIRASSIASHHLRLEIVDPTVGCTAAEWQSRLRLVTFSTPTSSGVRAVQFRALRSGGTTLASASKSVDTSGLPTVALPTPSVAYTEDAGHLTLAPDVAVSASYSGTLSSASVQITGNYSAADDALSLGAHGVSGISSSFNAATGTLSISGIGKTVSEYQAVLRTVRFRNTSQNPSTSTRTVRFAVQDGAGTGSADLSLAVTAVNDVPFVGTFLGTATFTEGGGPVVVNGDVQVTDADSATLWSGTVSITDGFAAGQDVMGFTNDGATMGNISGAYNAGSGVLTLTSSGATATVAQWQAALRAVTYLNSSSNPSTATRTLDFRVHDGIGSSAEGSTSTVAVVAVNDAPVITTSGGTAAFIEGSGPVAVDPALVVEDVDSAIMQSAAITITGGFAPGEDALAFANTSAATYGNIAGTYNADAGVLSLASAGATATVAQWQAALRAVTYANASASPNTAARTVAFVINDGTADSTAATKAVSVSAINTAPVVTTTGGTTPFVRGGGPVAVDAGVGAEDLDGAIASATVSITDGFAAGQDVLALPAQAGDIAGTYDADAGVLTLTSGSVRTRAEWETALRAITYDTAATAPRTGVRTITFAVADDGGLSGTAIKRVSVTGAADPPADPPASAPDDAGAPGGGQAGGAPTQGTGAPAMTSPVAPETPAARVRAAYSAAVARATTARTRALAACAARAAAARASCRTAARRAHARAVSLAAAVRTRDLALDRCTTMRGRPRVACVAAARARYARDVARARRS